MLDRLSTTWLRPALSILGLAGLLALSACGGGSGAPNNPYVAPPTPAALTVQPSTLTAYSGVAVTVTITSGVAPFFAFSGNATVLPVAQNVAGNTIVLLPSKVTADTPVIITVQDSAGQTAQVTVNVVASSILNTLTFAPSGTDCETNLCSGQKGTATVVAKAPGGAPLVARPMRFDVVFGPVGYAVSTDADGRDRRDRDGNGGHSGVDQRDDPTGADPGDRCDVGSRADSQLHRAEQYDRYGVAADHRTGGGNDTRLDDVGSLLVRLPD